jgi:hypothetical protein
MGDAVDRLRDLVNLTIRVPSYVRHVDGKFIHVDAYTRKGKAAEKAPSKPKVMARTIPATLYAPKDLQTNENVKVAIDTIRQTLKTDLGSTLSSDTMENWLSAPETRDTLKSHAFLFDAVRKPTHKGQLTKSGKIMAGREWGRYDTLVRTSTLLARMKSGSIAKPEAEKEFWDLMDNRLVPKVMGADYPISVNYIRAAMNKRAKAFGIGTEAHVPEKPTGVAPAEVVLPITEIKTLTPGGITAGKTPEGEVLEIHAGDEVWIDLQSTSPANAWAVVVKHPDGTGHTVTGSPNVPAKVKETADITLKGLGVPGSGIKYKHYGTVSGAPAEVDTVHVPTEGGMFIVLEPGEKAFQAPVGNVLVGTPDGPIKVYSAQKQITMLPGDKDYTAWNQTVSGLKPDSPYQPISPTKVKATTPAKGEGAKLQEELEAAIAKTPKPKAKKKTKAVVPTAPLDQDDIATFKNAVTSYGEGGPADQWMAKQRKRWTQAIAGHPLGKDTWGKDTWPEFLAQDDTIALLTDIVGRTESARTDPSLGLDAGGKAKLSKDRKRYEALLEAGTLARDLDTIPEDELDVRLASVGEKMSSGSYGKVFSKGSKAWSVQSWPFSQKTIWPGLQERVEKRLFEERKKSLGFDPAKADDATLATFLQDKGAGDIAPWLSTEQKRDWIAVWLRDPSIFDKYTADYYATDKYADVLEQITKAASVSAAVGKVTKMTNLNLHAHAKPAGPDPDQQKVIAEQLVKEQKKYELLLGLKKTYQNGTGDQAPVLGQQSDGKWHLYTNVSPGDQTLTQAEVLDLLVVQPGWKEKTQVKALTDYMMEEAEAQELLGMPTGAGTRKVQNAWIKDRGGSNVGKMTQDEREEWITAHLSKNNFLKYALEVKAGKKAKNPVPHPGVETHPGSPDSPSGKAAWQLFADQAAVSVWGDVYRLGAPLADWTNGEVVTFATSLHLDYGFPPGEIPSNVARDRAAFFLDLLPGTLLPPPSPGLQAAVPDEPKGPLTKPEGVPEDAFALLEALKVLDPDQHPVSLFSKTADGFNQEVVDKYLKNSAAFGKQNALLMAGIYSAPLTVKQAAVAAMSGLQDEAPFPDGFLDYVKAQVQAGVFDPEKPEGYYGAVSNGETVYYLKPGDKVMEAGDYQIVAAPAVPVGLDLPEGLPAEVTTKEGVGIVLQPGDVAYAFKETPKSDIYIHHLDGTWTLQAGTSQATKETVEGALTDGWTNPDNPSGVYANLEPIGAGAATATAYEHDSGATLKQNADGTWQYTEALGKGGGTWKIVLQDALQAGGWHAVEPQKTTTAPPKDEVYGYPLKPGDEVYIPPAYELGTVAVWVLHADGTVETIDENGTPYQYHASHEQWHEDHAYPLIMTGPTATASASVTMVNGTKVDLKPGDVALQMDGYPGQAASIRRADGTWRIGFEPKTTVALPGTSLADSWDKEYAKVLSGTGDYKVLATGDVAAGPATVGHGPTVLAPGDQVYKSVKKPNEFIWVKKADGSWLRLSLEVDNLGKLVKTLEPGSTGAKSLEKTVAIPENPPVLNPAQQFPNIFTAVAPGPVIKPKSVLWVQHADGTGSWITASGVENVTDEQVDGLFSASHPYIPLKPTSLPPKPIATYEQAQAMGLPPTLDESDFNFALTVSSVDDDYYVENLLATDEEIVSGLMTAKENFGVTVSPAFIENAPPGVRRAIYDHVVAGNTATSQRLIATMNWLADHGHFGSKTYKPPFPAGKAYTPYILSGLTDESSVASWPYEALATFQVDYQVNGAAAIAGKLDEVLNGKHEPLAPGSAANEPLKFSEDKDAPHPGGSHSGNRDIKDQHGNKYLYKVYQNDPQSPAMRVEQEVYSARISQLLGYHHPPVQDPVKVLGKYAYIQLKVPFKFDMQGVHPEDLDDNILTQVAEEHVLDWVLANADTYYANIAVSGDGKHVIGIDKGQAFKHFPNDELSPTYTGGNPIAPYYNDLYAAVVSHKITKERADAMVRHLLIRAKRVAHAHDPEYRDLLEKAFASRTDFKGMTKDEFIDALLERKHAAAESFEELWKGVYAKAGYTWDLPALDDLQFAKIETERGSAWSGISPEYFEAVEQTKVHGRSAMFAGTDLEDGHLLFFEEHDTEGNRVLLGEGKLREGADGRLTAWLQSQKVADAAGSVVTPQVYMLPKNDAWFQKIVAAAMTVNHHTDDGEYNQAHLDALATAKADIVMAKEYIAQHTKPAVPASGAWLTSALGGEFPDKDAETAFLDMAQTYLDIIGEIETAKANQAKTPNKKYTQYVYAPKAKAKVDEEWKSQGFILQKTEDGVWHHIDESTGADEIISEQQASDFITSGSYTQGSQGKAVTSLQVKVYKRKASRTEGILDLDTGELKESGGEEHTGSSGHEYDVEIGDRIVLEYRPWHGANQPLADQGFFRIRVKNWDGDEADLDLAFQQLAAMGVDLTPADEESLQLLYWRLWEGVASTRNGVPTAVKKVLQNIKAWRTQNPNASATEELEFLRSAWSSYLGPDKVENVDFMPHFDHTRIQNPEEETGHPYWYRPDATMDNMVVNGQWHFGSQNVLYGGSENDKVPIGKSGGLLASDERLRLYGHWLQKGSSLGDKPHGSTGQVFTRPKFHTGNHIAFVPDVFLRMQSYAASNDVWGDVKNKANYAPFSIEGLKQASTEMMVKNTVTVLDSFIVMRMNSSDRETLVKWYHDHGVHTIRGVPVEDRFTYANSLSSTQVEKLWAKELAWREEQKQAEAALAA